MFKPICAQQLYRTKDYHVDGTSGSTIGFSSFLNQSANIVDLAAYQQIFGLTNIPLKTVTINNGVDKQDPSDESIHQEANLDSQVIAGLVGKLPVTQYIVGGSPPFIPDVSEPPDQNTNEPYLEYYEYLLSLADGEVPWVLSNSYGDDERTVPIFYARRVCNLIAALGLRGVSILESTGDNGVGSACVKNDGTNGPAFDAQFPASCPYLTAVGGTQGYTREVAWVHSAGGFSNYFPRPAYQDVAVDYYLEHHMQQAMRERYEQFANLSGRAYPDISAHSEGPKYVTPPALFPSFNGRHD